MRDQRVLVAETDREVREVLAEVLESLGAKPHVAPNVDEAILALRALQFDALVLEAGLWNAREAQLASAVRQLQPNAAVVLTGPWEDSTEPSARLTLLEKPFSPAKLTDALSAALSASQVGVR